MCDTYNVFLSHHTCPPPGQSMWLTSLVFDARANRQDPLNQFDDITRRTAAVARKKSECGQRRLVACNEQNQCIAAVVDEFGPEATGNRHRVETLELEALAVDERMTATLERCHKEARRLLDRQGLFTRSQHLHEERHRLVDRTPRQRIDVLDQQAFMRVLRVIAMLFEKLAHRAVAVYEHRRRAAYAAEM